MPVMTDGNGTETEIPLADWVEAEAGYYHQRNVMGDRLIAETLEDLARRVRQVADGPISVQEFLGRWEVVEADRLSAIVKEAEARGWERGNVEGWG